MATMDPGQRGLGRPMRRQGPVDRLDESIGERFRNMPFLDRVRRLLPQGQIPPELLSLLMAQLQAGQGGGIANPQQAARLAQQGGRRAPSGRVPMGGAGRPPVVKMEDLVRALSGGGARRQAPQANMRVPQARR